MKKYIVCTSPLFTGVADLSVEQMWLSLSLTVKNLTFYYCIFLYKGVST